MAKAVVRRVNEWDGPAMLKIYSPYIGTCSTPETELPALQDYIMRIDKYTYGLGWLMCEIDSVPVGFCHLSEDRNDPKNLFSVELQLYVKPEFKRRGVATAMWALMRDIMQFGNRRQVTVYVNCDNTEAERFFESAGFSSCGEQDGYIAMMYRLSPAEPDAERPTKPYLIENLDYERARENAAQLVKI